MVDNIKSGLENIKSNNGFDILSLYENNNNQTIGSLISSKQESDKDKEFIKAKRKEIILNSDALTSSKAIKIYKTDVKDYKTHNAGNGYEILDDERKTKKIKNNKKNETT